MQMQFEQERDLELGEKEKEPVRYEQMIPRLKVAALCKAILNPHYFDNYKFWHFIYEKGINAEFVQLADRMACINGAQPDEEYFLGSSGDVDYFARWPDKAEVIFALKTHLAKDEMFRLLSDCYYIPLQNLDHRRSRLRQLIDMVYEPDYVHCKTFSTERFNDNKILGLNRTFYTPSASIWLKVLSGFMAALGSAALLLALTSFSFPAAPVAAVAGVALLVGSYGLFKHADRMPRVMEEHEPTFQPR